MLQRFSVTFTHNRGTIVNITVPDSTKRIFFVFDEESFRKYKQVRYRNYFMVLDMITVVNNS